MVTKTMRGLSRLIFLILIGVLASAQLATAAYACPTPGGSRTAEVVARDGILAFINVDGLDAGEAADAADGLASSDTVKLAGSECRAGLDSAWSNLCLGHCQSGQQSAAHASAPSLAPAMVTALYTLPAFDATGAVDRLLALSPSSNAQAIGDPPQAILHCRSQV